MNNLLKEVIKKQCGKIKKIELLKESIIYEDYDGNKFVAKENQDDILGMYNYLNSRGFEYLPRLEYCDNVGYVYDYVNDTSTPKEQKMSDLVKLDALLHNKTVYYKDLSIDEIKEIYERLMKKINDTFSYYDDLVTMIEGKVFMSPSEYMLVRNCSSIFSCINFCHKTLDEWYELESSIPKKRTVLLHNNLSPNHLIKSDKNILISWNHATYDLPIYDFIKLYKNNYSKYDFNELYKEYEKKFPLLDEEKKLMYVILFIPERISFDKDEFLSTIKVSELCNYLFTTDRLFMEHEAKNTKKENGNIDEK